jgi:membrane associated rhomboid family serine protease
MKCPRCPAELNGFASRGVHLDRCPRCEGIWFDCGELGKFNGFDSDFPLRPDNNPPSDGFTSSRCPGCTSFLSRVSYAPGGSLDVERCIDCKGVWLDSGVIEKVRKLLARKIVGQRKMRHLDDTVRREQEKWQAYEAQIADEEKAEDHPTTFQWLFLFLTRLPVEVHNPVRNLPRATLTLMALNLAFFAAQNLVPNSTVLPFTLVPNEFRQFIHPYSIITAMFLHGNLLHLMGNLYFFYTFGDNVEDFLGPKVFVILYFFCGVVGALAHFAANMHSNVSTLGASGAISGVFAAYMLLYPRRRIYFLLVIWPMKIRAVWYGLGWIGVQILSASLSPNGGVAWWGHIGGFFAGIVFVEAYLRFQGIHPATAEA